MTDNDIKLLERIEMLEREMNQRIERLERFIMGLTGRIVELERSERVRVAQQIQNAEEDDGLMTDQNKRHDEQELRRRARQFFYDIRRNDNGSYMLLGPGGVPIFYDATLTMIDKFLRQKPSSAP
jgi:hypothetical protein